MTETTTYLGMDVHKRTVVAAVLVGDSGRPLELEVANTQTGWKKLVRAVRKEAPGAVRCCYEAGPTGYGLKRFFDGLAPDFQCMVVAPSLIPVKPGERIKTDRRDARKLAQLLRGHVLTEVSPPTPYEEAVRDVCRCRMQAKEDLQRARHQLSKFLLRRGLAYTQGRHWTKAHNEWLRGLTFELDIERGVFNQYLWNVEAAEERLASVVKQLEGIATTEPYAEPVARLRCFHGIDTIGALSLIAELHGFQRFGTPRELMAYLGLVPSEHSSGGSRHRGGITKAGNTRARRLLVEAAWHYRHRPRVSPKLASRRKDQSPQAIAIAQKAQLRLHRRYRHLVDERGKPTTVAVTAVARELAGFLWAVLYPYAMGADSVTTP